MTQLPAFGALFDTFGIAVYDLMNFGASLLILAVGFAFSGAILFGVEVNQVNNFWKTYERLFYYALGDGDVDAVTVQNQALFNIYYMVFSLIFFFILLKTLISVVSIRYRHLRALKQEFNEANARILNAQVNETKTIIKNLI